MIAVRHNLIDKLRAHAIPLASANESYTSLLQLAKNKKFILLGEATHGTSEFYTARVEITKRLISEYGLNAIAVEADWPSAYRINRYVRWQGTDTSALEALGGFTRFPLWMWRNTVIANFVEWLRKHNEGLPPTQQVGFYGVDMYSMYESIAAVLEYLDTLDPEAALAAREHYACLGHIGSERHYGRGVKLGYRRSCEEDVIKQLTALITRRQSQSDSRSTERLAEDQFEAEQNARLIRSAEAYYRHMFDDRINTWNLRDSHMTDTLERLHQYLSLHLQSPAKIAVWEHNSHLGDASATSMSQRGEHNVGQLMRERYGPECLLVGFTTYTGTVTAASEWDGVAQRKKVRPALPNSIEDIFHRTGVGNFFIATRGSLRQSLGLPRLQRAIGVLYLPEAERSSHYFNSRLASQFDAVLHYDDTRALEPLDAVSTWIKGEEVTYPFGV